jgi:hypothetical protein
MAITITATLDASGVKTGATQAANAVDGLKSTSEAAGDSLQNMASGPIDELARLSAETGDLRTAIKQMGGEGADAFNQLEDGATRASKALANVAPPANVAQKIAAVSTGFLAVVEGLKKGIEFARQFDATFREMASEGNAAAGRVVEQLDKIHGGFSKVKGDPLVQESFDLISDGAGKVSEYLDYLGRDAVEVVNKWSGAMVYIGESLGFFEEGTIAAREHMEKLQQTAREGFDQRQAEAAAEKAVADENLAQQQRLAVVNAEFAAIERDHSRDRLKARLDEVDSIEDITRSIAEESEAIRDLARDGKLTDDQRKQRIEGIRMAEQRVADLRTKEREDQLAAEQASSDESVRLAHAEADAKRRILAEEVALNQRAEAAKVDAERRAIEERKRLLGGKDVGGAEKLIGEQNREQVRKAFSEMQARLATQQTVAENGAEYNAADPAKQKRMEAELAKQRQKALANAQRQFDRGQADPAAIRAAQGDLANAAVDGARASGKLSNETAQALKESVGELVRTANEVEQLRGEVDNVRKLIGATSAQGQRRRSQNAGSRQ